MDQMMPEQAVEAEPLPDIERPPAPVEPAPLGDGAIDPRMRDAVDDGRLSKVLLRYFTDYKGYKDDYVLPVVRDCLVAYDAEEPAYSPFQHTYVLPEPFRQLQSLNPILFNGILGNPDLFAFLPKNEADIEQKEKATALVVDQIKNHGNWQQLMYWLENATLHGTSVIWPRWDEYEVFNNRVTAAYEVDNDKTLWEHSTKPILQQTPTLECIHIADVFVSPYCEDITRSPYAFVRRTMTAAGLKDMARNGVIDMDALEELLSDCQTGSGQEVDTDRSQWYSDVFHQGEVDTLLDDGEKTFEILFAWSNQRWEFIIAEQKYILRAANSPQGNPLRALRNYPTHGLFYGRPEISLLLAEHHLLTDTLSMWADGRHLGMMPIILATNAGVQKLNGFTFGPGAVLEVDSPGDVSWMQNNAAQASLTEDVGFLLQQGKSNTGITDGVAGAAQMSSKATTHQSLTQAAMGKLDYKLVWFGPEFEHVYADLYRLNATYLKEEQSVLVDHVPGHGAIFTKVRPSDFAGPDNVRVKLATQMDTSDVKQQRALQIFQLMGQDPMIDGYKLRASLLRTLDMDPKQLLANPAQQQGNALEENENLKTTGVMGDVSPNDDHRTHLQIHELFLGAPETQALPPDYLQNAVDHIKQHMTFFQQQMAAMQQQQMGAPPGDPSGSPVAGTEQMTEAMTGAGAQGAAQGAGIMGSAA